MRDKTSAFAATITLTTTAQEILGPNPRRKSFMLSPVVVGANGIISISLRPGVLAGQGSLNYLLGATFPTLVDDDQVGNAIGQPWYGVSANGGEVIEITEFFYDLPDID